MVKLWLITGLLLLSGAAFGQQGANPVSNSMACQGEMFDPVNDPNWNNAYPVTVAGVQMGQSGPGNGNPPLMGMPPVCDCGGTLPGIGVTYWEPSFIGETARTPGCMTTLGGEVVLDGYENLASEESFNSEQPGTDVTRRQVHWYRAPLFEMLELFSTIICLSPDGFDLEDMTEVNDDWQDDSWSSSAYPEVSLFASETAALSCIPDMIAASINVPIDLMFWCQGAQGIVYPFTGNVQHMGSPQSGNLHVLGKFVAGKFRMGGLLSNIGPWAECSAMYSPTWVKSQFRIDPIHPVNLNETVVFGMPESEWGMTPPANTAVKTDSAFLLWIGKQCCVEWF